VTTVSWLPVVCIGGCFIYDVLIVVHLHIPEGQRVCLALEGIHGHQAVCTIILLWCRIGVQALADKAKIVRPRFYFFPFLRVNFVSCIQIYFMVCIFCCVIRWLESIPTFQIIRALCIWLERRVVTRTVERVVVVGTVNYFLTNVSMKLCYLICSFFFFFY
jgi:hypothetical protein